MQSSFVHFYYNKFQKLLYSLKKLSNNVHVTDLDKERVLFFDEMMFRGEKCKLLGRGSKYWHDEIFFVQLVFVEFFL